MARGKKYQPEQVVNLLRQIEVGVANGKSTEHACRDAGIVEQTYYRWRKEYGGLQVDQARRRSGSHPIHAPLPRQSRRSHIQTDTQIAFSGSGPQNSKGPDCSGRWWC